MGGPGGGPAQGPRSNPKIKEIMTKIGKGPQALQGFLGEAIKQPEPAWETIQPKTREFAQLAAELKDLEPTRGTKDSWAKLSLAFAESAAELDHAAQSKDKNQTKETLDTLGSSCMACHRAHRTMGPGMGGPRGGRGMGPPPGGFGGPPPGDPPPGSPGGFGGPPPGGPGGPSPGGLGGSAPGGPPPGSNGPPPQ